MGKIILLLLLIFSKVLLAVPMNDAYQEGGKLGVIGEDIVKNALNNLDLKKEKIEKYDQNPPQTKYYKGITSDNAKDLVADGEKEYTYNEEDSKNNGIQAALKSFRKNPSAAYKINANNPNDPIIKRAASIMANAKDIAMWNNSNQREGCKESLSCHVEYVKRTCNEQTRFPLKRMCERVPKVTLTDDPYSGCNHHSSPGVEDCLAGEIPIPHYRGTGYGKIVLPKNRGARVGFSDSRHPHYYITATNETTGQVVIPRRQVSNGVYIELPISKSQDQTFSFVVERWDECTCNQPGKMRIYTHYTSKCRNWRMQNLKLISNSFA